MFANIYSSSHKRQRSNFYKATDISINFFVNMSSNPYTLSQYLDCQGAIIDNGFLCVRDMLKIKAVGDDDYVIVDTSRDDIRLYLIETDMKVPYVRDELDQSGFEQGLIQELDNMYSQSLIVRFIAAGNMIIEAMKNKQINQRMLNYYKFEDFEEVKPFKRSYFEQVKPTNPNSYQFQVSFCKYGIFNIKIGVRKDSEYLITGIDKVKITFTCYKN